MVYCLSPGPAPALNAQPFGRGISMGGGVHQRPVAKEIRVCHLGKIADQKHEVKRINLQGKMGQFKFFRGVLKPVLSDLKQQTMVRHQNGRTSRVLVPKEQPPRKLSGDRTILMKTLWREAWKLRPPKG